MELLENKTIENVEDIIKEKRYFGIIKNNEFQGFTDIETEETVELTKDEYNQLLDSQSDGNQIYWNVKNQKLEFAKLQKGQKIKDGKVFKDIELLKNLKISEIERIKEKNVEEGFKVKISDEVLSCRTRQNDQINIQALIQSDNEQIPFKFKDENLEEDVVVVITKSQIQMIFDKGIDFISRNMGIEIALKTKIKTFTTIKEIESFNTEEIYKLHLGDDILDL